MPRHKFIFTYSVSPYGDDDKYRKTKQANKVRDKIAEIEKNGWTKLNDVETTFAGDMSLTDDEISRMKDQAEKIVKEEIRKIIDEHEALMDVWVHIALMVDHLGKHMEFRI